MSHTIYLLCILLSLVVELGAAGRPRVSSGTIDDVDGNSDGVVNFTDFLNFASSYNVTVAHDIFVAQHDHDGSGTVDFPDFLIFISFFGQESRWAKGVEVNVTWPADTLVVGEIDTLKIALLVESAGWSCDQFSFNLDVQPQSDSLEFRGFDTFFEADTVFSTYEVLAVGTGDFRIFLEVQGCGPPSFLDTLSVTVIPSP